METNLSASSRPRPSSVASAARFEELNGIRGWAALSVVVFHMTWETFGALLPVLRNPVTGFFLDARLAVSVFFVLSGEALSSAYFAGGGESAVARLAVKRYSRLTVPIAAACLITYALYKAGLVYNVQAGGDVHRMDWMGGWLNPAPDIKGFFKYVLLDVYNTPPPEQAVIPFLWTMEVELKGSILVFGLLLMFSRIRYPWVLIVGLFALLSASRTHGDYACFLAGMSFASLRSNGYFSRAQHLRFAPIVSWFVVVTIAVLDGLSHWKDVAHDFTALTAVILLFAVFCNSQLCAFFASKVSLFLGRLSFPLYLVQFPFLVSLTSFAICYAKSYGEITPPSMLTIAVASIAGCLLAAYAFEPVERLTHWIGNRTAALLIADPPRFPAGGNS
jgi:peptidoglycan/LPS O-acetylase OafA/YrhL